MEPRSPQSRSAGVLECRSVGKRMKTSSPPASAQRASAVAGKLSPTPRLLRDRMAGQAGAASRDTEAQRQQLVTAKYGQIRKRDWPPRCTQRTKPNYQIYPQGPNSVLTTDGSDFTDKIFHRRVPRNYAEHRERQTREYDPRQGGAAARGSTALPPSKTANSNIPSGHGPGGQLSVTGTVVFCISHS